MVPRLVPSISWRRFSRSELLGGIVPSTMASRMMRRTDSMADWPSNLGRTQLEVAFCRIVGS
jgi:hypothetical protein